MDKVVMFAGAAGAAVLFVGCVDLAQTPYGSEEARWQQVIRENYSGYEAPRTAPPATVDNVSPRLIEEEQLRNGQAATDPDAVKEASDDPSATVDKAADGSAAAEAKESSDGPKAEEKKDETSTAKADEPKSDAAKAAEPVKGDDYVVVAGDTLGGIAKKFYGDARRYDIILNANPQLNGNPDKLRLGMKLVIPKI